MFNRSKYKKILTIMCLILIIAVVGIVVVIGCKMYNNYYIEAGAKVAIEKFEESLNSDKKTITKYKDFTVIGIIEIPDINIKYPILQENMAEAMETSIVLMYTSQGLNKEGNSAFMGHNYRNNTMFSNLQELKNGEYIYITDSDGERVRYKVYSVYNSTDTENEYITRNVIGKSEISLVTITNDRKEKTIVLASEYKEN